MYIFIVRLDCAFYEANNYQHPQEYESALLTYDEMVLDFFSRNRLNPFEHAKLKYLLQAFLLNTLFLSQLTTQFQKTNLAAREYAEDHYPKLMEDWKNILTQNITTFAFVPAHVSDIAASLVLITTAYTEIFIPVQKRVLFSLTGTSASLNYFQTKILNILPKNVEPYFNFNKPLTNSLLYFLNIDTCIYNYRSEEPITFCRAIRLPNIPTDMEWIDMSIILLFDVSNY